MPKGLRPKLRIATLAALLSVIGLAAAGCDFIGYRDPGFAGSWQTVQDIDPATGQTRTAIGTTTKANNLWAWILSFLGQKPTFSVACLGAPGQQGQNAVSINWRDAIGLPGQKRNVNIRIDNSDPMDSRLWTVAPGGRLTTLTGNDADQFVHKLRANNVSVWAQTITSRGTQILVFNIRGFDLASSALSCLTAPRAGAYP